MPENACAIAAIRAPRARARPRSYFGSRGEPPNQGQGASRIEDAEGATREVPFQSPLEKKQSAHLAETPAPDPLPGPPKVQLLPLSYVVLATSVSL